MSRRYHHLVYSSLYARVPAACCATPDEAKSRADTEHRKNIMKRNDGTPVVTFLVSGFAHPDDFEASGLTLVERSRFPVKRSCPLCKS